MLNHLEPCSDLLIVFVCVFCLFGWLVGWLVDWHLKVIRECKLYTKVFFLTTLKIIYYAL